MGSRRSNSVDGVHGGRHLMEEELPLPVYDPSLQPAYVLALEDTREYVLNKVERRISAVETNLGRRIDSLTKELRRDRLAARGRH